MSADQKREGEEGRDYGMRRVFVLGMALGLAMATLASCSLDTIFSHGALNEYWLTMTEEARDWLNHHELLEVSQPLLFCRRPPFPFS